MKKKNVLLFQKTLPGGILIKYSGKQSGNMKVGVPETEQNRAVVSDSWLLAGKRMITSELVHSTDVAIVNFVTPSVIPQADALATSDPRLALAITFADCPPVLLADPEAGVIGVAHCGYQGILGGILENAIEAMKKIGACRKTIQAWIGPGICGKCYEFDTGGYRGAEGIFWQYPDAHHPKCNAPGKSLVNLRSILKKKLLRAGISRGHFEISDVCTLEDERFFSARRDRTNPVEAGIASIGLLER